MVGDTRHRWQGFPQFRAVNPAKRILWKPTVFTVLLFFALSGYTTGSIYWLIKKDNELEKFRRVEIELQNKIKERDLTIQQNHQQIEQLERRVEIINAIQELSYGNLTEPEKRKIAQAVEEASQKYGHNPYLLLALMSTESSMNPDATSSAGAKGLMQLIPATGNSLAQRVLQEPKLLGLTEDDLVSIPKILDIEGNIRLGTLYLTKLMLRYNDLKEAIFAYNLGPTLFDKRKQVGGPFPQKYLAKVTNTYHQLIRKRDKKSDPIPTLADLNIRESLLAQANPINH